MDASAAFEAINEFVKLAAERRTKALPDKKKARLELLDEQIRDVVEGARPAPKRIANPSATAPSTAARGVGPAKIEVKASAALEQALELSTKDKSKLNAVRAAELPKSSYTPPALPAFMADYYSDSIVPARIGTADLPSQAVTATGETADLQREVRILLGLERPPEPAPAVAPAAAHAPKRRAVTPAAASASAAPAAGAPAPRGVQVIVHLLAGGTQRGRIERFEPGTGRIELLDKDPSKPAQAVELKQVLAVFFGTTRGKPATRPSGTGLVVRLTNDRQISGMSPDYREDGSSLTIVPNPSRGNIDRVWVPAWAVKSIELT